MSWFDIFLKDAETETRAQIPVQQQQVEEHCDCAYASALTFAELVNQKYSNLTLSSVYCCIEKISSALASMSLRVVESDAEGHQKILGRHPLQVIFRNRGPQTATMYMTMKAAIADTMKRGNGYIYINRSPEGEVISLRYVESGQVSIMYNERNDSLYYLIPTISKGKVLPENLIHFIKNTKGPGCVEGVSVLTYARDVLNLSKSAESSAEAFFNSGCNVNAILSTGPGVVLNAQQREELKASWAIKGSKTSIQVLPANIKVDQLGIDPQRAQLIEARKYSLSEVARFFDIPLDLLHASDKSMNVEELNLIFLSHCLTPWIRMIEAEMSRKIFGVAHPELSIDMDDNEFIMRCNKTTQSQYLSTLVAGGIISVNEARAELGLQKVEGGDKLIVAYSDVNQNTINGNNDNNDTEKEEDVKKEEDVESSNDSAAKQNKRGKKKDK